MLPVITTAIVAKIFESITSGSVRGFTFRVKHRGDEEYGRDSGSHRSFSEGDVDRSHLCPEQADKEAIDPVDHRSAEEILDAQRDDCGNHKEHKNDDVEGENHGSGELEFAAVVVEVIGMTFFDRWFDLVFPSGIHEGVGAGRAGDENEDRDAKELEDDKKDGPIVREAVKILQLIDCVAEDDEKTGEGVPFSSGVCSRVEVGKTNQPDGRPEKENGSGSDEENAENRDDHDSGEDSCSNSGFSKLVSPCFFL